MKGSLVLTVLIALYAVQANGASMLDPSASDPSITGTPQHPLTSASSAPDSPSTLAPSSPESTLGPNSTSSPSTSESTATVDSSTTTVNSSTTPSASTLISTGGPSGSDPSTTDSPATPSTSDSPSNPVSTLVPNSTGNPSTSETFPPSSPSTSVSTSNSSAPTSNATGGTSVPTSSVTNLPSTTQEPLPCDGQPCKYGAACNNLKDQHVCLCPYGFFYGSLGCQPGNVFPGQLQLTVPYEEDMQNIGSSAYQKLYNNVTQFFNKTFENHTDYEQTILVSVGPSPSSFRMLRTAETTTYVKIINMFDGSTKLTESEVTEIIQNSPIVFGVFINITQCGVYGCDTNTTTCENPRSAYQFPTCICQQDLAKKNPEDKACLLCNDQCTSDNHKQCLHGANGVPSCSCQPDYYKTKNEKCEACSFGFSGKECSDNSLAILVGVATACGVVIVVLSGALIYKLLRAKKDASSETRSLLNSESSSTGRVPENNYATNFPTRERIFPRVQTRNPAAVNKTVMDSQEGRARNIQEPGIANKAYIPEQDYDDDDTHWMEMSARNKF